MIVSKISSRYFTYTTLLYLTTLLARRCLLYGMGSSYRLRLWLLLAE